MLKRLELTLDQHYELIHYRCYQNIEFLSTAFDLPSINLLFEDIDGKFFW